MSVDTSPMPKWVDRIRAPKFFLRTQYPNRQQHRHAEKMRAKADEAKFTASLPWNASKRYSGGRYMREKAVFGARKYSGRSFMAMAAMAGVSVASVITRRSHKKQNR